MNTINETKHPKLSPHLALWMDTSTKHDQCTVLIEATSNASAKEFARLMSDCNVSLARFDNGNMVALVKHPDLQKLAESNIVEKIKFKWEVDTMG